MNCNDENHQVHMCALKAQGRDDLIRSLADHPTVACQHCGARANTIQNICAAHLGANAPNIEGGHGTVSLDEVAKPHAGQKMQNAGR
jgi:hypothetical protein